MKIGVATMVALVGLSACSKDDEPGGDNPTSRWKLVTISRTGSSPYEEEYDWDNKGRIIKDYYEEEEYSYGSKTVTVKSDGETREFSTNSNGYIVNGKDHYGDEVNFTYNSKNQLTSFSGDSFETNVTWSNDRISSCSGYWDSYKVGPYQFEYASDSEVNADCARIINGWFFATQITDGFTAFWMSGLLGTLPSQPLSRIKGDGDTSTISFKEIDSNGCPGIMTVSDNRRSLTYELEWAHR